MLSFLNSVLRPRWLTDISDFGKSMQICTPNFSFVIRTPIQASEKIMMTPIREHNSNTPGADSIYADIINVAKMRMVSHGKAAVNGDL